MSHGRDEGVLMIRAFTYLLAGALLATTVLVPAAAASATTSSTHVRVTTLLASNEYILYKQATTAKNMKPEFYSGGKLYARDLGGPRQSLPGFNNTKQFLYLTGHLLVQAQNNVHNDQEQQTIRWRDLNVRTTGTAVLQPGEVLAAAAPDGWVTRSTAGDGYYGGVERLTYVHMDGTRVALGEPFPEGQSFGLSVSDTGIIATPHTSDEAHFASKVRYLPWSDVRSWRTLYTTSKTKAIACAQSSRTYAACTMYPADTYTGATTYGLISLTGAGATWVQTKHPKACKDINIATRGDNLYAIETSDAGVCAKGKLYRFDVDGRLVNGDSHRYSSTSILVGLGSNLLVSSLDQRHIDSMNGVTQKPRVLVRV